MILKRAGGETWFGAACRFAELEGVSHQTISRLFGASVSEGFSEKRSAYLALAELGIVDDVEGV